MIYAICIDCDQRVAVDEEETRLGISGVMETSCVGDKGCKADDLSIDHRLDDNRRGQAEWINKSSR